MSKTIPRFADLISPITREKFELDYCGKAHLYVSGNDDKFEDIASWDVINKLLADSTLWTGRLLTLAKQGPTLDPKTYCVVEADRDGHVIQRPVPELIHKHLEDGATLVLNHADTLTPELSGVAGCLQLQFRAQVKCNIYCSWQASQGFATHFDGTDVFVLQIAGRKFWNLYEGFYERPLSSSPYVFKLGAEENERLKGDCIEKVELTPGDFLYIPRGQYHDAIASSEASLHLTFGIVPLVGVNVFDMVKAQLEHDPLFNQPLPHYDQQHALKSHLAKLGRRLEEIICSFGAKQLVRNHQKNAAVQESFPAYDMPFNGRISAFKVGNVCGLLGDESWVRDWLCGRDWFTDSEFAKAFPDRDINKELRILIKLCAIEQIG